MGIDGIGKNGKAGSAAPLADNGHIGRPRAVGADRAFEVAAPELAKKAPASAAPVGAANLPRTALERLRAGEIDVNGYVDVKIKDATAHLSALPPTELEAVRDALRKRMATDPGLVELVRTVAGGKTPELPSED